MTQTAAKKRRQAAMRAREKEQLLARGRARVLLCGLRVEQTAEERQAADAVLQRHRRKR